MVKLSLKFLTCVTLSTLIGCMGSPNISKTVSYQIPKSGNTIAIDIKQNLSGYGGLYGSTPTTYAEINLDGDKRLSTMHMPYEPVEDTTPILAPWIKTAIGRVVVPVSITPGHHHLEIVLPGYGIQLQKCK